MHFESSAALIRQARRLRDEGTSAQALSLLARAVEQHPTDVDLLLELAALYRMQGNLVDAEALFRCVLDIEPASVSALNNLAVLYGDYGNAFAAESLFEAALEHEPNNAAIHSNALLNAQYIPGMTAARLFGLHQQWNKQHGLPRNDGWQAPRSQDQPHKKLKLGFLSSDFYQHPVAAFMLPLFQALDRTECEIHCWRQGSSTDNMTAQFKALANSWHEVSALADNDVVTQIRAFGVDILFDMGGHSFNNRLGVFAQRAAPVQISWAGYVGTTGLTAMDYLLADPNHVPAAEDDYYAEKIIRMPQCYVPYLPPEVAPSVSPLPALSQGHITFAAFHNPAKLNNQMLALWSKVLNAIPRSRLVLQYRGVQAPDFVTRAQAVFASGEISTDRVSFRRAKPQAQFLATYNAIDIALDTFPYSGGVTTCEALWMGVPVVTLTGQTFAGRHTTSYLNTVGLNDLIAETPEQYVSIAVNLAHSIDRLSELRRTMRERMQASPLLDHAGYAQNFLAAMRRVWTDYCLKSDSDNR